MIKYVLKRLITLIPIILALTFFVFTILYMTPGDPTEIILGNDYTEQASIQLKQELGLDKPFIVRYVNYVLNLAKGDFGISYITRAPVSEQLLARFPNTFKIVIAAMVFCVVVGMPIGIRSATKPNSLSSKISMVVGLMGVSMPVFWLGFYWSCSFPFILGGCHPAVWIMALRASSCLR